jgi:hypothetical protein
MSDNNSSQQAGKGAFNDAQTLRAKGGDPHHEDPARRPTDPVGLSRRIMHVLEKHDYVRVLSVGPTALNSVMAAFRLAAREIEGRTHGAVLVNRQSEYTAEIDGKPTKGICTRIFAVPIKFAQ